MLTMPGLLCWEWSLGKAADVHKAAVSSEGWLMLMMLGLMPGEVGSVRQCSVCERGVDADDVGFLVLGVAACVFRRA